MTQSNHGEYRGVAVPVGRDVLVGMLEDLGKRYNSNYGFTCHIVENRTNYEVSTMWGAFLVELGISRCGGGFNIHSRVRRDAMPEWLQELGDSVQSCNALRYAFIRDILKKVHDYDYDPINS